MKVAAVILNYNSAEDCRICIEGLKKQQGVLPEIIVVDNCSRPEECKAAEELCRREQCTFLKSSENRGYNAGNNIGLRYAAEKGFEYVLIANPDMVFLQTDYLQKLAEIMEQNADIAACGSDIVTPEGIHQNPRNYSNKPWYYCFSWVSGIFHKHNHTEVPDWICEPERSRVCNGLNGCCLLLRLSLLKQINFFDERTFLYGEEPILAYQIQHAGKKLYYSAEIQAVHNHRKSREGTPAFCAKYWKQSQLLGVWHYSDAPFYGKCAAALSVHLYFFLLNLRHRFQKR